MNTDSAAKSNESGDGIKMATTAKTARIQITAPAVTRRTLLVREEGDTGSAYYLFTDSLGCRHLAEEQWGEWYCVNASGVMQEAARSAAVYAGQIALFEASEQWPCTYEYLYGRLASYRRLFNAVSKEFPV